MACLVLFIPHGIARLRQTLSMTSSRRTETQAGSLISQRECGTLRVVENVPGSSEELTRWEKAA